MKAIRILLCFALSAFFAACAGNVSSLDYVCMMENRLSPEEKEMLMDIHEPVVVGVPLEDARRGICILKDGEIRSYGKISQIAENRAGRDAYLSSVDCGLTWKLHYSKAGVMGSCTYIPESDIYITSKADSSGTYVLLSGVGPDDDSPSVIKLDERKLGDYFLPRKSAFSDRIWFTGHWKNAEGRFVPVFIYSDNLFKDFSVVELPATPGFEIAYPHKGMRWDNCGAEPVVEETGDGKMLMLIRNCHDSFYWSHSDDSGETWSAAEPSPFHGTATTAYLLRLRDGRVLSFWNNTRPLPELDHNLSRPALGQDIIDGVWEDVFTNRDINHVAVSDDGGLTWTGARELFLNPIRNNADYRYVGGPWSSYDKSVHQFQAYELPYGKILVSFGQNVAGRKMLVFDVDWLYEKSRSEDFMLGLGSVSTHVYVNDVCGSTVKKSGNGHCSWNRTSGVLMCPDPEGSWRDVACMSHRHDHRLLNDYQGLVWNFPAGDDIEVEAELYLSDDAMVRLSLADCWFNPCDPFVGEMAQFSTDLSKELTGRFHKVGLNLSGDKVTVCVDGKIIRTLECRFPVSIGLSYLHIQNLSGDVYVRQLKAASK